jgi:Acyl-CoA thioester hydrolase/BAAT N-terminal region
MGRWRRAWVSAGAVLMLVLAGAGCGGPAAAPVRLDAGPAATALVDPVHVSVSGLPPEGLVTVQARTLDQQGQPWVSATVRRLLPVTVSVQTVRRDGFAGLLYPSAAVRPGAPAVVVSAARQAAITPYPPWGWRWRPWGTSRSPASGSRC